MGSFGEDHSNPSSSTSFERMWNSSASIPGLASLGLDNSKGVGSLTEPNETRLLQASASASTAPSRARSSTAPSSASPSNALSCSFASRAPTSAGPSKALWSVRASRAPPSVRASRAPPSVHASQAPPSVRAYRAPPSVCASRAPPCARSSTYFPQGNFFGGVVGLQPGRGLGLRPQKWSRHGLLNIYITNQQKYI